MKNKIDIEKSKWNLGSTRLSNIIAIVTLIFSIFSLWQSNEAMNKVETNINAESIGQMQKGETIINEGPGVKEINDIAEEMMDDAYQAEDIIRFVNENPNLSFCLIWHGTEEEYQNTNWDEMPPNIKIEKYDEKTNTVTFTYN